MTQAGTSKLIENTLEAKDCVKKWHNVALILSEALAVLDFRDIESDLEPYYSALKISEKIKEGKLDEVLSILKIG